MDMETKLPGLGNEEEDMIEVTDGSFGDDGEMTDEEMLAKASPEQQVRYHAV